MKFSFGRQDAAQTLTSKYQDKQTIALPCVDEVKDTVDYKEPIRQRVQDMISVFMRKDRAV